MPSALRPPECHAGRRIYSCRWEHFYHHPEYQRHFRNVRLASGGSNTTPRAEQSFQISYQNDDVTLTSVAVTTTTVASTLNPSVYGQSVTFTATVNNTSGSGGVPTGSVAFYDGLNLLGAGTTLSGSGTTATSTFAISTMTAGIHPISVVYTATGGFFGSTSSNLNQTVNTAALTITANNQTKVYGAALPALSANY